MRTCLLCTHDISLLKGKVKLCRPCYERYEPYLEEWRNTEWYDYLVTVTARQDHINKIECGKLAYYMESDIHGTYSGPTPKMKQSLNVTQTEYVDKVLKLFDESYDAELQGLGYRLSLRALEKQTGVHYITIRNILRKHKRQINKPGRRKTVK